MIYPIPSDALDDRLAWVGVAGAGKTYNAGTAVERLLGSAARAVIADPLGVWWGLRLKADGLEPAFPIVVFGGPHGDLPLTEHAGALIGEAAATMAESCIVDLSDLETAAAERRFMLGFLRALYQHATGEPVHLILDEADMWAPQTIRDKEGDATKLFAITERIVRRGRIEGFIPWLITQRPAEISKSILSMVDGLIAMTLTSPQDRDALDAWIGGQADPGQGAQIKANLPRLPRGQGVVWIPRRGILAPQASFPRKETFDSSATPKRGEARSAVRLQPLDLGALQAKLATVETDLKANDPKALKMEIMRLRGELMKQPLPGPTPEQVNEVTQAAYGQGYRAGLEDGQAIMLKQARNAAMDFLQALDAAERFAAPGQAPGKPQEGPRTQTLPTLAADPAPGPSAQPAAPQGANEPMGSVGVVPMGDLLTEPLRKIINAIAWWEVFGQQRPTQMQAAYIAGYAPRSGTWDTYRSRLRTAGLIGLADGAMWLTPAGREKAIYPVGRPDGGVLRTAVRAKLSGPLQKFFDPLLLVYPHAMSQPDWAAAAGYARGSGTYDTYRSRLRSLGIIELQDGQVRAADWLFPQPQELTHA